MKKEYIKSGRINQKLETRDKILTSAQFFINKGLEFTLEDVAKKSGISRATIYRYYSKIEILANEAGLDINTKSPENIIENLKEKNIEEIILGIQNYFNTLAIDHESAFRKYLSTVLASNSSEIKRGARRKKTLQLAFENISINKREREKLVNLLTILMGIEPLIVTKDVSGLTNNQSMEIMNWGVQLILKGYFESEKK
ncbi:TetR/AcrR family transcriptional regulator [Yeosuana sp. MJ-SS3]|uniref:TetR/AcrR family transcriptional regulator n=1 Tax=Gilvirhabdus luticola TaxID=3079858 RepID=A0ABU3U8T5_9FLAO|nr:TetR/AcrR family transcriptional regulator [Yeosuana sp. MJ-SS3]MDU8886816.1 TetR/AcrR family transcriptional regulator [Yeosuana sp. MJ-SS3]